VRAGDLTKQNDREGKPMRVKVALTIFAAFLGLSLTVGPGLIAAQEGTPTAAPGDGVTTVELGRGTSAVAPDRILILQQRTFAPGGDSGAHPAAGPVVLSVRSGEIVFAVVEGAAQVSRAGTTQPETIAAGSEATLEAGDSVFYDEGVVHDVRNDDEYPAVTLEARLNPAAENAPATPTP
jgi:quercetin dioxygenase-like cupin family protein